MYEAQLPHHVAYFSIELALDSAMPTYAGGLGVLAGDTLRSAADLGLLMVAVSLLYRKGHRERGGERSDAQDAADLYRAPAETILPIYHGQPEHWTEIMRATIAFNASFFNSQRMLEEYMLLAYQEQHRGEEPEAGA